ncbi:MAG: nucleotidyltransferase domain-containing protein, partial [Burkholderiales bacterium]
AHRVSAIASLIARLTRTYPGISGIWLFGSRANGTARDNSDWDLLIFADEPTFQRIQGNRRLRQSDVDLLMVRDGNDFREPWGKSPKRGFLSEWEWRTISENEARYLGAKRVDSDDGSEVKLTECKAIRIWPEVQ